MRAFEACEIEAVSSTADDSGRHPGLSMHVRDYLLIHTAALVHGTHLDQLRVILENDGERVACEEDGDCHTKFLVCLLGVREGARPKTGGHAVLISQDGYFATAAHNLRNKEKQDGRLAFCTVHFELRKVEPAILSFRTVIADQIADFAIVKADVLSPIFLSPRASPPKMGEGVFLGAGWLAANGGASHGVVTGIDECESETIGRYRRVRCTAFSMPGDSGTAVTDDLGRWLGVALSAWYSHDWTKSLWRTEFTETKFVMPHAARLLEIIENDRRKEQAKTSQTGQR
ncbi:MAG: trypsin-like peptidase domain-containing protein [Kiritimatiellae bacterium]|nr:trypsin-like peptidase domain-containing protein [Kiritimatiellia bacterium]